MQLKLKQAKLLRWGAAIASSHSRDAVGLPAAGATISRSPSTAAKGCAKLELSYKKQQDTNSQCHFHHGKARGNINLLFVTDHPLLFLHFSTSYQQWKNCVRRGISYSLDHVKGHRETPSACKGSRGIPKCKQENTMWRARDHTALTGVGM